MRGSKRHKRNHDPAPSLADLCVDTIARSCSIMEIGNSWIRLDALLWETLLSKLPLVDRTLLGNDSTATWNSYCSEILNYRDHTSDDVFCSPFVSAFVKKFTAERYSGYPEIQHLGLTLSDDTASIEQRRSGAIQLSAPHIDTIIVLSGSKDNDYQELYDSITPKCATLKLYELPEYSVKLFQHTSFYYINSLWFSTCPSKDLCRQLEGIKHNITRVEVASGLISVYRDIPFLHDLHELSLYNCHLELVPPNTIKDYLQLNTLHLDSCYPVAPDDSRIDGITALLKSSPGLKTLRVSDVDDNLHIFRLIADKINLEHLYLLAFEFSASDLDVSPVWPNLLTVDLSNCRIDSDNLVRFLACLQHSPSLSCLVIDGNFVDDSIVVEGISKLLSSLPGLKKLSIARAMLNKVLDYTALTQAISLLPGLSLDLNSNRLFNHTRCIEFLKQLVRMNLASLDLSHNLLNPEQMDDILSSRNSVSSNISISLLGNPRLAEYSTKVPGVTIIVDSVARMVVSDALQATSWADRQLDRIAY